MEPRSNTRRRGYAGAAPAVPTGTTKPPLQWKQILLTALITGAGFYIGSRLMKAASEKADGEETMDSTRALLLGGAPGMAPLAAAMPQPMYPQMHAPSISAAADGKSILITPEALARFQAGR